MGTGSGEDTDVDCRMQEWGMNDCSPRLQTCGRRVLGELPADALLTLKDSKLEVTVQPEADHSVWAYFPIHRNRMISRKLEPRPETRVLLVLGEGHFERDINKTLEEYLRNHLGHVLLYLREHRANNDCAAAMKQWRRSVRGEEGRGQCEGAELEGKEAKRGTDA